MLITKKVTIEVNNRNLHIFRKKLKSKYDLKIGLNEISVSDLSKGSHCIVDVQCDSCNINVNVEWRSYLKFTKNETEIYCCKKCNNVKVRKTNLERYGVVCNSQLESNKKMVTDKWMSKTDDEISEIIDNRRETNNIKYGVDHYTQTDESKERFIQTCLDRYGITNPSYSEDVKKKRVNTKLEKFGYVNNSQTKEWKDLITEIWKNRSDDEINSILERSRNTCNIKYGVNNYAQTDDFKEKSKKTLMSRYGVEHPMHSDIIFSKQQESAFKTKTHQLSNLKYQGTYELDFIEKYYNSVVIEKANPIQYKLNENIHYYHPDFYLPEYNLIIEVKSSYTYELDLCKNLAKREYSIKSGFNFIFIIDKDYSELESFLNLYPKDQRCQTLYLGIMIPIFR
jgi:hypothetical protein